MKIAFFGLPLAALALARDGHEIVWAATSRRGALGTRRLASRIGRERVFVASEADVEGARKALRESHPELIVSWFWTKKIPSRVLSVAPSFGVHPSLLPRHRGPDPYFWAIDAGDETTGVTAHALDDGYDTGAIFAQRQVRLEPAWDSWRLARALDRPSLALVREVARAFAERRMPAPYRQDECRATVAPEPTNDDLAIRWSWTAERIERRVRAAGPWPGAWTQIGDRTVTIVRVRPTRDFPRALAPSEGAVRRDGVAVVRAGEDALELIAGRGEGEEVLSIRDLAGLMTAARTLSIAPRVGLRFDESGRRRLGTAARR
jgi:methionyl-tRNA formyltransferase